MTSDQDRPYVDPFIEPGDQGTEPWTEGETAALGARTELSPADPFAADTSAGLEGSADKADRSTR